MWYHNIFVNCLYPINPLSHPVRGIRRVLRRSDGAPDADPDSRCVCAVWDCVLQAVRLLYEGIIFNLFLPTVPTFAVRETDVSRHNGGTSGAPLKPLRDDSALTANVGTVGMNGLRSETFFHHYQRINVSK